MNKTLQSGLVIVGVVIAVLLVAYAAQAAGLTSNPRYGMQGGFAGMGQSGMMAGFQGSSVGMGAGMMAMMHGGQNGQMGAMMDSSQMPHSNLDSSGNYENCPHLQDQQNER